MDCTSLVIMPYAPRVLHINAALMAIKNNWRPIDDSDSYDSDHSHPAVAGAIGIGGIDFDGDGYIGGYNSSGQWVGVTYGGFNATLEEEVKYFDVDGDGVIESPDNGYGWN